MCVGTKVEELVDLQSKKAGQKQLIKKKNFLSRNIHNIPLPRSCMHVKSCYAHADGKLNFDFLQNLTSSYFLVD